MTDSIHWRIQPGFEGAGTSVTAAVCLYGYYGGLDTGGRLASSPDAMCGRARRRSS
jgi:hypothetical protein